MSSQPGQTCAYCGLSATHFCSGCGKWVCDKMSCAAKGAAAAFAAHPAQAVRAAPAAVAYQAGTIARAGKRLAATAGQIVSDALNFKP